jgi:Pentapeptide repeats (8 copies)
MEKSLNFVRLLVFFEGFLLNLRIDMAFAARGINPASKLGISTPNTLERPKMKRLAIALILTTAVAAPAFAQNAGQIASVKAGKSCAGCNLFQADFDYEDISGKNLAGARIRQSDMSLSTADRTNFSRADLSLANMYGIRATGANFTRANLAQATLVGGYFSGSTFAGANMTGANISGAELAGARGLTQGQLNTACGDAETTLPRGLSVAICR